MKILRSNKKQNWRRQITRREEARIRQEGYDKLSPQQKLERLGDRAAKKQRKRLEYEIGKR